MKKRCWITEGYSCPYNKYDCYKCQDKEDNDDCRFNGGDE